MPRPASIVRFERLYLASFGLGLVGWMVAWGTLSARLAGDPRTAPFGWMLPATAITVVVVSLLLLHLVARRASLFAKWAVTALAALAVARFLFNLPALTGGTMAVHEAVLALVTLALTIAAAVQLFQADARLWFGEDLDGDAA